MPTNHFVYRLSFSTPLHIGNERDDYASGSMRIHSDTLYAAIWWAYSKLGFQDFIPKNDSDDLGFALSSCFPFIKEQDFIYFFPRPFHTKNIQYEECDNINLRKKIKKITWIDKTVLATYLSGNKPNYQEEYICGAFLSSQQIKDKKFVSSQIIPRVMVPREAGQDTKIFYTERFYFTSDTGLYFIAQFENDEQKKYFEAALRYLSEEGIGTDRNIGNGKFEFEIDSNFQLPNINQNQKLSLALGLYCPENKEQLSEALNHKDVGYELIKRGGWLSEPYNSWRKKSVYMFNEGSVFSYNAERSFELRGRNVDIKPDIIGDVSVNHPVWRCGRTLFLNF